MTTITFLGTSGSVVTRERMCSGVLFEDTLIDVGFGVLTNLIRSGTKLDSINRIFISHTHSDHIGDFTGLIWAMAMENRTRAVQVICSASTAIALEKILDLQSTPRAWVKFRVDFVRPEKVDVMYMRTVHDPETLAYRFKADRTDFVYGADTARSEQLGEFCHGCELLIHDATFLDGQEPIAAITNHSTARDAGLVASIAGAKRLALTHISPGNEGAEGRYLSQASAGFDGKVLVAKDRYSITL